MVVRSVVVVLRSELVRGCVGCGFRCLDTVRELVIVDGWEAVEVGGVAWCRTRAWIDWDNAEGPGCGRRSYAATEFG